MKEVPFHILTSISYLQYKTALCGFCKTDGVSNKRFQHRNMCILNYIFYFIFVQLYFCWTRKKSSNCYPCIRVDSLSWAMTIRSAWPSAYWKYNFSMENAHNIQLTIVLSNHSFLNWGPVLNYIHGWHSLHFPLHKHTLQENYVKNNLLSSAVGVGQIVYRT